MNLHVILFWELYNSKLQYAFAVFILIKFSIATSVGKVTTMLLKICYFYFFFLIWMATLKYIIIRIIWSLNPTKQRLFKKIKYNVNSDWLYSYVNHCNVLLWSIILLRVGEEFDFNILRSFSTKIERFLGLNLV